MPERKVWECKIGSTEGVDLPPGSDFPMREAIAAAYLDLTGKNPEFIFSGWGAELTEIERAVVDDRLPDDEVMIAESRKQIDDAVERIDRCSPAPAPVRPDTKEDEL